MSHLYYMYWDSDTAAVSYTHWRGRVYSLSTPDTLSMYTHIRYAWCKSERSDSKSVGVGGTLYQFTKLFRIWEGRSLIVGATNSTWWDCSLSTRIRYVWQLLYECNRNMYEFSIHCRYCIIGLQVLLLSILSNTGGGGGKTQWNKKKRKFFF